MDRITQLQDGVDQLAFMLISSVDYLNSKAPFKSTNKDIPITQSNPNFPGDEEVDVSKRELAESIIERVKQNEMLINIIPEGNDEEETELQEMRKLKINNDEEYDNLLASINELESLRDEINDSLAFIQENLLKPPTPEEE